jgi:hypothetical protein
MDYVMVETSVISTDQFGERLRFFQVSVVERERVQITISRHEETLLHELRKRNRLWGCVIGALSTRTEKWERGWLPMPESVQSVGGGGQE